MNHGAGLGLSIKLAALFFCAMLGQWLWSAYFPFLGLTPQLLLVLTVAISARLGPVIGMTFGFGWGLFLDVLQPQLFGANALAMTLIGYGTGSVRRQIDVVGIAPQSAVVFFMTWLYFAVLGLLGLIFIKTFLWVGWQPFLLDPFYNCLLVPVAFLFWEKTMGRP